MKKYLLILLCCSQILTAKVFQGAIPGNGEIPDGQILCGNLVDAGDPLEITFDVSNVVGAAVYNVELELEINHTSVGDLVVVLSSPDETGHSIFGAIPSGEEDSCGDSSNLEGVYRFTDDDSGGVDGMNFFEHAQALGDNQAIPTGRHRTLSLPIFNDPEETYMSDTFESTEATGTWKLTIYDLSLNDIGSVTDARLFINAGHPGLITDGIVKFRLISGGVAVVFDNSVENVLRSNRYYYRIDNDSKEYLFPHYPDEVTYDADVAVLSWFNVDGKGFDAELTHNIDQVSESLKQAVLFSSMKITNNSNSDLNINLFNYADFDIFESGDNVGVSADVSNNYIKLFSNLDDYQMSQDYAQFRAGGIVGYEIKGSVLTDELHNNTITTLTNEFENYGPGDVRTAFQMSTLFPIASGDSHEFKTTMAIGGATAPDPNDPNAVPVDDLIFKDGFQ